MGAYYDEIEIEDMSWDNAKKVFHYPCPCGDRFEISKAQLRDCEDIATCPSCSLIIRVIYDPVCAQSLSAVHNILNLPDGSLISKTTKAKKMKRRGKRKNRIPIMRVSTKLSKTLSLRKANRSPSSPPLDITNDRCHELLVLFE